MKRKLIIVTSSIGLIIIVGVVIALFLIFSNSNNPTANLNPYKDTIFLDKFNSQPFDFTLSSQVTTPSLITPTNLPLYKYTLNNPIDFKAQLISKFKINSPDKVVIYNIDKNTSLTLDNNLIQIDFNIAKQSDVLGFSSPEINVKKAFEYLKTLGLDLNPSDYLVHENYFSTGAGEYVPSNKTSGDVQTLAIFYKLKEFSYIFNSNSGFMSLVFNKANDLLSVTINTPTIAKYDVSTTDLYLEYLNLSSEVLTQDFINKNGIFLPNYPTSKKITLTKLEYVYLPSKDNYLIPFLRLSDNSGLNEVLVPIINPTRIVYGS